MRHSNMGPVESKSAPDVVRWWARWSLRTRLTAATSAVVAGGMTVAAILLVWQVHASLVAGMDTAIKQRAQAVADQAEHGKLPARLTLSAINSPAVQVIGADGAIVSRSRGVDPYHRMFTLPAAKDVVVAAMPASVDGSDEPIDYRVAAVSVTSKEQGPLTVYAALPTTSLRAGTTELAAALAVSVPVLVVALTLVAWLLVGRALRPVEKLRAQAASIPGTDLQRRLTAPASRDELNRLSNTLNDLLGRIEASGNQQRQFIADAAHELRSPIASLGAQLEVAALHPDRISVATWAEGLLSDTRRLTDLANDLLALARMDADPNPPRKPVDVDDLVLDEVRRCRNRGARIEASAVSAGRVNGDPVGLARVARNLIDNAVRYTATSVTIALRDNGSHVELVVADDGPGIDAQDRERVFQRFMRLDDARSRNRGGAGLGLAIVHDVVRSHHGTIRIEDNEPGARFVVTIPVDAGASNYPDGAAPMS